MQRAIVCGIAISLMCSLIGLFLVLRKQSLFGDALAHAAFGGIAAGLYLGIYPLWTAFAVSVSSALALTKIKQKFQISSDATVAILLSSGLAMGVILISLAKGFTVDIFSFLFGSILLVSLENTLLILGLCGTILVIVLLLYKKLVYTTFSGQDQLSFCCNCSYYRSKLNATCRNFTDFIAYCSTKRYSHFIFKGF